MFSGSVIRKLSHSEEVFAQYEVFTSMTVQLSGLVDADALAEAFDALVEAHPVLASHLSRAPMAVGTSLPTTCSTPGYGSSTVTTGRRRETPEFCSIRPRPYSICG